MKIDFTLDRDEPIEVQVEAERIKADSTVGDEAGWMLWSVKFGGKELYVSAKEEAAIVEELETGGW